MAAETEHEAGSAMLEVGCGTGQLTQSLADRGFDLAAIDIGPSMIDRARHRLRGSAICFQVASFEEFTAPANSFDPRSSRRPVCSNRRSTQRTRGR